MLATPIHSTEARNSSVFVPGERSARGTGTVWLIVSEKGGVRGTCRHVPPLKRYYTLPVPNPLLVSRSVAPLAPTGFTPASVSGGCGTAGQQGMSTMPRGPTK